MPTVEPTMRRMIQLAIALALAIPAIQSAPLAGATVTEAAARLSPGEFIWAPQVAPSGPMLVVINLATQRAVVYRNGLPIGVTTISSGKEGSETPIGVYAILEQDADHRSNRYNNAPMPFMQRLTWDGIALHGGFLPGHPASHGCIRLPTAFAKLLFAETRLGVMVVVTNLETMPTMALTESAPLAAGGERDRRIWNAGAGRLGEPISVIVSSTDQEVRVIRAGREIAAARVVVHAPITSPVAFQRQRDGRWTRLLLPGQVDGEGSSVGPASIEVDPAFRARLLELAGPGTTVVISADRLHPELSDARTILNIGR